MELSGDEEVRKQSNNILYTRVGTERLIRASMLIHSPFSILALHMLENSRRKSTLHVHGAGKGLRERMAAGVGINVNSWVACNSIGVRTRDNQVITLV